MAAVAMADVDGGTKAGFFSAEDWAAAFPVAVPLAPTLSGAAPPRDPAAGVRAGPPSKDALLASLAPWPTFRALVSMCFALSAWSPFLFPRHLLGFAVAAAFVASAFAFSDPVTTKLAGGFAVVAIACVADPAIWLAGQVLLVLNRGIASDAGKALRFILSGVLVSGRHRVYPELSFRAHFAILPAWIRCVGDPAGQACSMLGHEEGDKECTCSGPDCSGSLPRTAGHQWVAEHAVRMVVFMAAWIFLVWTPLVLVPQVWKNGWSIFLGVASCAAALAFCVEVLTVPPSDKTLVKLEGRIRRRLLRRSLAALLSRARLAIADGTPFAKPADLWGTAEPYIELHAQLVPIWRHDFIFFSIPFVFPIFIVLYLFLMILSIAIGGCIPAWTVAFLALYLLMLFGSLWSAAIANREIAAIGELYSSALAEARELLVLAVPPDAPAGPAAAHLAAHAGVLERYLGESEKARRRFLGFAVGYGSLRALLVSLATVGFAAWGAARGFGVSAVLASVCPGRGGYDRRRPPSARAFHSATCSYRLSS
ncbi:hypothetical protein DFJ74DRAFT_296249 [Hyaloraphidium curvatum]|nr:hypothetical protein DFJ74DRAFT_296249 [Hyaloraphidium curvatum]